MPTINDLFPSKYLKADDLKGREVTVKIREFKVEKVGEDNRPVLYFEGKDKGFVVNKTNAGRIALVLGTKEFNEWPGKEITIGAELTDYKGEPTMSLRVKGGGGATIESEETF